MAQVLGLLPARGEPWTEFLALSSDLAAASIEKRVSGSRFLLSQT